MFPSIRVVEAGKNTSEDAYIVCRLAIQETQKNG
jgi:hypothetical protein